MTLLEMKKKNKRKKLRLLKKSNQSPESEDVDEAEDQLTNKSGLKDPISPKESDLPEITLSTIVDLIGAIRAGQSLKDKTVALNLKEYFTRLNGNERVALYAFLTGISKVMSNIDEEEKTGSGVATPDSAPYKINMKKSTPKVTKKDKQAAGDESPIVVGESANKTRELLLIERLK